MSINIFIIYYFTLIFCSISYILLRKKRMFSISDGVVTIVILIITSGGFFNSYGYRYGVNELNYRILFDYYILLVVLPFGLIIGSRIKIQNSLISQLDYKVNNKRVKMLLFLIFLYGSMYIFFIKDSVPLFLLLSGRAEGFGELAVSRIAITHDFDLNFKIPFILRYYRLFINDMLRFILAIVFLLYLENKKKNRKLFFLTLIITVFFHTYNFEKSGLIYITLVLFFSFILYKGISFNKNKRVFIGIALVSAVLMIIMYMLFMGVTNPVEAFVRMMNRAVLGQTAGIYYQDIILESNYNGNLWGKGVPTFLIDSVLGRRNVDLSREAYGIIYNQYANQGATGTTGGMPMFFLRSNFGYLIGTAILFILSIITGIIDNMLIKAFQKNENKIIAFALYAVMVIYFIQAFMGNFTRVFMLPFMLSPQIIIIIFTIMFLKFGRRSKSFHQRRL